MSVSPPPPVLSPPSPPGSPRADAPGARGWDGISRGFGPRAAELVDGPADGLADRPADEGTSAVATADIARLRAKTYLSDQDDSDSDLTDLDGDYDDGDDDYHIDRHRQRRGRQSRSARQVANARPRDRLRPLPDQLTNDLDAVFCGIRGGKDAMRAGHHWAGRNKDHGYFYGMLFNAGLTDEFHASADDWTFPERYSIGMTVLYTDAEGKVAYNDVDYARPYTATLVHKIHTLRPRVVCILGRTIADTVSMVLHQSTAEADPEYTVSEPTPPESGVLAFKIVHDMEAGRADATYLFKVRSPDRQASGSDAERDAEIVPLREMITQLKNGTFVESADTRTANIGPLLQLAATRTAAQAGPPVSVQPEAPAADRGPRSPSVDEPGSPPPPKRMRATGPSHSPFDPIAGPSGSREIASRPPDSSEPRRVKMEPDELKIEATETSIKPEPSLGSVGPGDGTPDDKKPALAEVARHREAVKKEKHLADPKPDPVKAEHELSVKRETEQLAFFD